MSGQTQREPSQSAFYALLPAFIFVVVLTVTIAAALITRRSLDAASSSRLESIAGATADRLADRLQVGVSIARGTTGLLTAEGRVEPEAFHRYVEAQSLERGFPNGRVTWVAAVDPATQESIRRLGQRNDPDFQFERAPPVYPVVYISPPSESAKAGLGLDLVNLPDRLAGLERARDRGEIEIITNVKLRTAPGKEGVVVIGPIYAGKRPQTLEERRERFRGVVLVSGVVDELMTSAFGASLPYFHVEVIDRTDGAKRVWRTPEFPALVIEQGLRRATSIGDTTLEVHVVPRESLNDPAERYTVALLVVIGLLLALTASGLTYQQQRARMAAEVAQAATRRALEENERRRALLDLVVEQSSDGIVMSDERGRLQVINPAAKELLGFDPLRPPEDVGSLRFETVDGVTVSIEDAPLVKALQGTVVRDARFRVHRKDGDTVLSATASPLRNPTGSSAGGLLVLRDQTQRLRAEADREGLIAALEFSNAELEQFASVASHDLKAPLRGIAQLAQWLEDDLGEKLSDENRKHLSLLHGRVRRLVALIDGILGYARAGQSTQPVETFEARAAVQEALSLLAPPPGSMVSMPSIGKPVITGDKPLLVQVLMNLLSNAFKHGAPSGAVVTIDAASEGPYVRFSVKDNGPGIAPEYHQRIWGMFQTLSPRDEKESTGIGLAVVRKVVQAQGGRVWLESEVGAGATFFFTWPQGRAPARESRKLS